MLTALSEEIQSALLTHGVRAQDFDFFLSHQPTAFFSNEVCARIGISPEKTFSNFDRFGNTSSASLGIALSEALKLGKIKNGQRTLLAAMGAGYHFGIASVRWKTQ
jgi:3-oxoacyl-[acyl-carrier-protein] synthase-3